MAKIVNEKVGGFKPFDVRIESKEELALLWSLLAPSYSTNEEATKELGKYSNITFKEVDDSDVEYDLWELFNEKMQAYGFRKNEEGK